MLDTFNCIIKGHTIKFLKIVKADDHVIDKWVMENQKSMIYNKEIDNELENVLLKEEASNSFLAVFRGHEDIKN